jgi:hypothetical protein
MRRKTLFSLISGALMLAGQASAQEYTLVPLDVHCPAAAAASECPAGLVPGQVAAQTSARGINSRGDIVGFYAAGGKQRGFLLRDGRYTSLEFPVAGVRATAANGTNARGEIVGQYVLPVQLKDAGGADLPEDSPLYCPANLPPPTPPNTPSPACIKAFHYGRGEFSTVMFPATVDESGQQRKHPGAIAQRISADGDIYGCLHDHDLGASMFGAAWTRSGTFSLTFDGGEVSDPMGVPMSMNNGGTPGGGQTIVGFSVDMPSGQQHGYLVRDGERKAYDPTATTAVTAIWDINANRQFVGTYREVADSPATRRHGFLQNPDSPDAITFDYTCREPEGCFGSPLGTVALSTIAFGLNTDGIVVGQYVLLAAGPAHGFVAMPAAAR